MTGMASKLRNILSKLNGKYTAYVKKVQILCKYVHRYVVHFKCKLNDFLLYYGSMK